MFRFYFADVFILGLDLFLEFLDDAFILFDFLAIGWSFRGGVPIGRELGLDVGSDHRYISVNIHIII